MGRRAPAQLIILSALVRSPKLRTMCIAELLTSALRSAKSPFVSTLMAGVGRAMLGPSTILFSGASDECAISSENRWRHCRKYGRQRDLQVRKVGWRLTFLRSYRCEQGRKTCPFQAPCPERITPALHSRRPRLRFPHRALPCRAAPRFWGQITTTEYRERLLLLASEVAFAPEEDRRGALRRARVTPRRDRKHEA